MGNPLQPSAAILCKLGSVLVHADEMISPDGHDYDRIALEQLIHDPDIVEWRKQMDKMVMLPKKRK